MTTIMIVDDEAAQLDIYSSYFRLKGYTVLTALSGTEALSKLDSSSVDILLTDYVMPGTVRSIDLANEVRKRGPKSIIIFMSGYDVVLDTDALGAYTTLLKPFSLDDVDKLIKNELKRFTS